MLIEDTLRKLLREELASLMAMQDPFCTMAEAAKLLRCNPRTAQKSLDNLGVKFTYAGRKPLVARADILRLANISR